MFHGQVYVQSLILISHSNCVVKVSFGLQPTKKKLKVHYYMYQLLRKLSKVMVFNTTFNNISVISWQSVLLVKETRVPGENHQPAASH